MVRALLVFLVGTFLFTSCEKDGMSGSEESRISQYVTDHNLSITEQTSSGLVYVLTQPNPSGAKLSFGQNVRVNYTGKLLSDKQFDSGSFSFTLGIGQVVRGFDEGISKMRVGEKAIIIFPSILGYGNRKQNSIPKNSPLVFEVEVVSAI